ncbi:MAG: GNAT family N-acetyltransferase [Ruminococcus sp.]|nr:GNAT family N-acetyltransferase [Ruminococcus sp.]
MLEGGDMIVSLYNLPEIKVNGNIKIKRAFVGDKDIILDFVGKYFRKNWVYEVEHSLMEEVSKCFVATEDGKIIGFACYDSSAKGFFGPIGVEPTRRGENIGQALLVRTLSAMKEYGYGYAIIGWVSEAEMFYRKTVGAEFIKGGSPENSVYSNLVFM